MLWNTAGVLLISAVWWKGWKIGQIMALSPLFPTGLVQQDDYLRQVKLYWSKHRIFALVFDRHSNKISLNCRGSAKI